MRNVRIPAMLVLGMAVLWGTAGPAELVAEQDGDTKVALVDDCDPTDELGWAPVGCLQDKGDVTAAEFQMLLRSPLYDNDGDAASTLGQFLVGHPSWRFAPSHAAIEEGKTIHIENEGGRPHTFTPVAEFGGGRVPPLLVGTQIAPECASRRGSSRSLPGRPWRAPEAAGHHRGAPEVPVLLPSVDARDGPRDAGITPREVSCATLNAER